MNVNLRGAFLCAREAVREFLRRGVRPDVSVAAGKIIFISSVHEVIPWAGHVNYAASKGGLMLLMKSLAQEVAEKRIRVNSHRAGRDPHADQRRSVVDAGSLRRADEARALQAHRRGRGDRPRRGLARVRLHRLLVGTTLFIDGGMTLYPGFETGRLTAVTSTPEETATRYPSLYQINTRVLADRAVAVAWPAGHAG